jgi:2,3,4,5-tetrahydropyridine-2-carboxylate N-succinyltransferase
MEEFIQKIQDAYLLETTEFDPSILQLFGTFMQYLNSGRIRAAEKRHGKWYVNHWVKKGILLGFKLGQMVDYSINKNFLYFDKSTFPLKKFEIKDNIRQVPGGSSIRDGAFVASGVVIIPPAYINVGAYIDAETMVDSHALVGSCAQIGKRVHISAGTQIGGVLEPIGAMPVIIEDKVLIGGNCGIFEGTIVSENCVIGAGTIITGSTPVFDLVENQIYKKSKAKPLLIPAGAVVVPGSRSIKNKFAEKYEISIYTPVIIKYRDERTSAATALEEILR